MIELKTNAVAVDEACCTAESGGCDDGLAPSVCTPECGSKLISMFTVCPNTLNLAFDGLASTQAPPHHDLSPRESLTYCL